MWQAIGVGVPFVAAAAVFIAAFYFAHLEKLRKMEIIQRERLIALEKGLPLPEWPVLDTASQALEPPKSPPNPNAALLTAVLMLSISIGAMGVLYVVPGQFRDFWVLPLPVALTGLGLFFYHFLPKNRD